jgi:lantibiotic biosynthesis protein
VTLVPEKDRTRAAEVALAVAERLKTRTCLETAIAAASSQTRYFSWNRFSFASGFTGLSLLWAHLERCYPGAGWGKIAHDYLSDAISDVQSFTSPSASLFGGLSGIAFVAQYAAEGTARYDGLLTKLDNYIFTLMRPNIDFFANREAAAGVAVEIFDLISGLSGTALYLLTRRRNVVNHIHRNIIDEAIKSVFSCLIQLSLLDNDLPAWHTPKELSRAYDTMSTAFPSGYLNCGLAHGIPGPLGVMALGKLEGIDLSDLDHAIESLATWLLAHRHDDGWGMNWPTGVPLVIEGERKTVGSPWDAPSAHSAWCYGSPGIAQSLLLSGLALNKQELCDASIECIEAILRRPPQIRALNSPIICHGTSGLLQIVLRFCSVFPRDTFQTEIPRLLLTVLSQYNYDSLLGFQSRAPEGNMIDNPALLDGAAGVSLVLLSVAHEVAPDWDRAFMLS